MNRASFARPRGRRRRGAATVLAAVMMVTMIGFAALAVDTAVLSVAWHQLDTAADAAALAGAQGVADEARLNPGADLDALMAAARGAAVRYATANAVLGAAPVVTSNDGNVAGGDVVVGYLDPTDPASVFSSDPALLSRFNSMQVLVSRSESKGGLVPAFFARIFGSTGSPVSRTAVASALNYTIDGFRAGDGYSDLLPIVLDSDTYSKMIDPSYSTTDQYAYDPDTGTVGAGADGVEESLLYPVKSGLPGNWGTVKIGVSNNSTSTLGAQIRYGVTSDQLNTYPGGVLRLDASASPPSVQLGGNPGISAGIKDDLAAIIGKPRTIPIYDQSGGNGNNAWYRIVAFAPVRVLDVSFKGNPKYVIVQPALTKDTTAIPGSLQTGWTAGGLVRLHLTR